MTLQNQLTIISDTLKNGLPSLLSTAGLDNFNEYLPHKELRSTDLELCVYPDMTSNTTDMETSSFIIKAQLYQKEEQIQYYDVINPFIKKYITPQLIGYTNRVSLVADFYPPDRQSTSYVFFSIMFSNDLDDCED